MAADVALRVQGRPAEADPHDRELAGIGERDRGDRPRGEKGGATAVGAACRTADLQGPRDARRREVDRRAVDGGDRGRIRSRRAAAERQGLRALLGSGGEDQLVFQRDPEIEDREQDQEQDRRNEYELERDRSLATVNERDAHGRRLPSG